MNKENSLFKNIIMGLAILIGFATFVVFIVLSIKLHSFRGTGLWFIISGACILLSILTMVTDNSTINKISPVFAAIALALMLVLIIIISVRTLKQYPIIMVGWVASIILAAITDSF